MNNLKKFLDSKKTYIAYNAALESGQKSAALLKEHLKNDPALKQILEELTQWPGPQLSSHKSAEQFYHKLNFLVDIGADTSFPDMEKIADKIIESMDLNNVPTITMTIAKAFGGTGEPIKAWALCDAPNILYALKKAGCTDTRVEQATVYLAEKISSNGFHCIMSDTAGKWRGPGKKEDPCPYATLVMMKLLQLYGKQFEKEIDICGQTLLDLWENSMEKHPYIFYMGNDFRKLKLPCIWYDIMHVCDVLSRSRSLLGDQRLIDMKNVLVEKMEKTSCIPESVYKVWKDWDFGQKKQPSEWLEFNLLRILNRFENARNGS